MNRRCGRFIVRSSLLNGRRRRDLDKPHLYRRLLRQRGFRRRLRQPAHDLCKQNHPRRESDQNRNARPEARTIEQSLQSHVHLLTMHSDQKMLGPAASCGEHRLNYGALGRGIIGGDYHVSIGLEKTLHVGLNLVQSNRVMI
jgi:hypothetical protein